MENNNRNTKDKKSSVVIANSDNLSINIESLIHTIRGQKVIIDFDLAMLYGVLNKRLNEQVKRNIERFPDDFMFQLTKEEWNILRSQIVISETPKDQALAILRSQFATTKDFSKIRTLPYAFTHGADKRFHKVLYYFKSPHNFMFLRYKDMENTNTNQTNIIQSSLRIQKDSIYLQKIIINQNYKHHEKTILLHIIVGHSVAGQRLRHRSRE
jgi:hypothetical protein